MSVVCHEGKDHVLVIQDEAFCVTTPDAPSYAAVCHQHIDAIPADKRHKDRIDGGLDVHYLHSIPNALPGAQENLSLFNMQFGDFKFSITAEDAQEYLPSCAQKYL